MHRFGWCRCCKGCLRIRTCARYGPWKLFRFTTLIRLFTALTDQGHIYAWGANTYGQLGNGTKLNSSIPVRIGQDLGRFTDIAAVHAASISTAMTDYGKVWYLCAFRNLRLVFYWNCPRWIIFQKFELLEAVSSEANPLRNFWVIATSSWLCTELDALIWTDFEDWLVTLKLLRTFLI